MKNGLTLAIEPLNRNTNLMVTGALLAIGELFEERDFTAFKEKGVVFPRWECPYKLVSAFTAARKTERGIRFKIWIKKGPQQFEDGEFLFKRKKQADKKIPA